VWPSQWGGNTTFVVVRGNSMLPKYHTGDIVIARSADQFDVGDVVVYAVPEQYTGAGRLIMHRVLSIESDGSLTIQGDNRSQPDNFDIFPSDVRGVEAVHLPKVGLALKVLSTWWLIAILVGIFAAIHLWPDDHESEEDEPEEDQSALESDPDATAEMSSPEPQPVSMAAFFDQDATTEMAPIEPWVPAAPPSAAAPRPPRAQVVVDGDGLAAAGWPLQPLEASRPMCVEAADEIAERFGTQVVLVFPSDAAGLSHGWHARVQIADGDVEAAIHAHVARRKAGLTMLVVTDSLDVGNVVWELGGSVMGCSPWLALGEQVGALVR
jgi:signal peptidase